MLKINTENLRQFVELAEMLKPINKQLESMAEKMDFDITIEAEEIVNRYGGNNTFNVEITLETMYYASGRMYVHMPAHETQESFINKIKAYCFDIVADIMSSNRVFA